MQDSVFNIYPWIEPDWRRLFADGGKLHHALLIGGQQGIGKSAFAEAAAARLLCEAKDAAVDAPPCGVCQSCRWFAGGNHPDFRKLAPEDEEEAEEGAKASKKKPSTVIKIDQVRGLEEFVYVGSHRQGNRVVLISPAEAMNPAATNSLLKILEEPPSSVYFLLVSTAWRRLLPTIRSRCRMVVLGRPENGRAQQWLATQGVADAESLLQVTGGAPLDAAAWHEQGKLETYRQSLDILAKPEAGMLAMAGRWDALLRSHPDLTLETLVISLQKWLVDLAQVKLAGSSRFHGAWSEVLGRLAKPARLSGLLGCYNELIGIRAVAKHPLNTQLFLEDLAARYLRALRPEKA